MELAKYSFQRLDQDGTGEEKSLQRLDQDGTGERNNFQQLDQDGTGKIVSSGWINMELVN